MKKRLFEFVCPHCSHAFYLARDTYLLLDGKGAEQQRLKDRTFFTHQCQSCGTLFELTYPLMARDIHRQWTLVLSQGTADDLPAGSILTRTPRQFLDAFSILDLGLTLQDALPVLKAAERKMGAPCRLKDYDWHNHLFWIECEGNLFAVPESFRH